MTRIIYKYYDCFILYLCRRFAIAARLCTNPEPTPNPWQEEPKPVDPAVEAP